MTDFADDRLTVEQRRKLRRQMTATTRPAVPGNDRAERDATTGPLEPVRTGSLGRIQRSPGQVIQRDTVTVEDAVDDEPVRIRTQAAIEIEQPSTPLMITDRPWAEIEAERAEQAKQRIAQEQQRVEREAADKQRREQEAIEAREVSQQNDPKWQQAVHTLNRPMGEEGEDRAAPISNDKFRVRGRQLKDTLADQRGKQVAEQRKIDDEKQRVVLEQQRLAAEAVERQTKADDLIAEPTVKPLVAPAQERATAVIKECKPWMVNVDRLNEINGRLKGLVRIERWSQVEDLVDELSTEAARISEVRKAVEGEQARYMKLTQPTTSAKRVYEIAGFYTKFRQLSQLANKDTETSAALVALQSAIQVEEDKSAASNAAAQQKIALRNAGLWPGNNKQAAVITTKTRADVGDDIEERTAVVEALDALKDASKDHSFAKKWGVNHGNSEGNLPGTPGLGGYTEYYVRKGPAQSAPGPRRLVKNTATGFVYYSKNHYGQGGVLPAFVKVTDA